MSAVYDFENTETKPEFVPAAYAFNPRGSADLSVFDAMLGASTTVTLDSFGSTDLNVAMLGTSATTKLNISRTCPAQPLTLEGIGHVIPAGQIFQPNNYVFLSTDDHRQMRWAEFAFSGGRFASLGNCVVRASDFLHEVNAVQNNAACAAIAGSYMLATCVVTSRTSSSSAVSSFLGLDDPFAGYDKYSMPNWDGYDADPITEETINAARYFLKLLPKQFAKPAIAPGGDGGIGFEWLTNTGPFRKLYIDIGPGRTWRAYWRLADGTTGTIPTQKIDRATQFQVADLFKRLVA
jgi:hypothetical protein